MWMPVTDKYKNSRECLLSRQSGAHRRGGFKVSIPLFKTVSGNLWRFLTNWSTEGLVELAVVTPVERRNFVSVVPVAKKSKLGPIFFQNIRVIYKLSMKKQKTGRKTNKNPPKKVFFPAPPASWLSLAGYGPTISGLAGYGPDQIRPGLKWLRPYQDRPTILKYHYFAPIWWFLTIPVWHHQLIQRTTLIWIVLLRILVNCSYLRGLRVICSNLWFGLFWLWHNTDINFCVLLISSHGCRTNQTIPNQSRKSLFQGSTVLIKSAPVTNEMCVGSKQLVSTYSEYDLSHFHCMHGK